MKGLPASSFTHLAQGLLPEAEFVKGLVIGGLVPPEPLPDAGHVPREKLLNISDVVQVLRQRVINIDSDHLWSSRHRKNPGVVCIHTSQQRGTEKQTAKQTFARVRLCNMSSALYRLETVAQRKTAKTAQVPKIQVPKYTEIAGAESNTDSWRQDVLKELENQRMLHPKIARTN